MTATTETTKAIYDVLIARMMNYVPTGGVLPNVSLAASGLLGAKRCWIVQAPDNATFPYVVARLRRQVVGDSDVVIERFTFDVDVFNRPRQVAQVTAVMQIADQIQAALSHYRESTAPIVMHGMAQRQTYPVFLAPADRDVIREYLSFIGDLVPAYMSSEAG